MYLNLPEMPTVVWLRRRIFFRLSLCSASRPSFREADIDMRPRMFWELRLLFNCWHLPGDVCDSLREPPEQT